MSGLVRLAVDRYADDPRLVQFIDPEDLPDDLTVRADIALTEFDAGRVRALPPGEKASVWVIDWLTETVLLVMAKDDGEYVAAEYPEATAGLARRRPGDRQVRNTLSPTKENPCSPSPA